MIIGYKPQFPAKILAGIKKHTIREDIYDRWHAGMKMHQSTGVRTKQYRLIRIDRCTGTQLIEIVYNKDKVSVQVDNKLVGHYCKKYEVTYYDRLKQLAKNDGFDSVDDFFRWFNRDFKGKIIHWTELRY